MPPKSSLLRPAAYSTPYPQILPLLPVQYTGQSDTVFYGFLPKGQEITGWYDTQKAKQQNMLGGIEQISGVRSGETGVMMKLSGDIRSEKTTGEAHRIFRGGDG